MSDFFEQPNINNVVTKDKEVVTDFSRLDPNITLGDFSRDRENRNYENPSFSKPINFDANLNSAQEYNSARDYSGFSERQFKKRQDKENIIQNARVKIFVTVFLMVTLILTGFVIFNAVQIVLLNKDVSSNQETIDEYNSRVKLKGVKNAVDEIRDGSEQNISLTFDFKNDILN